MVVYNIYVKRKYECREMNNCVQTPNGLLVFYPGTLFNVLQSDRGLQFPIEIMSNALPVYVEEIHEKCVDDWSRGKAVLICGIPEGEKKELCICLAEWYWYAMYIG